MSGGGPISQLQSQQQTPMGGGASPLNTGGGMSGGQTQMPNFAAPQQPTQQGQSIPSVFTPEQFQPYANAPRTREEQHRNALAMGYIGNPGNKYLQQPMQQQPYGGGFYGQQPQPMFNPFQPQQPSFMQDPEFQGYQTQAQDLNRQMNEYMQKAPMYQQLQDLQGKMSGYQQRYQQQELQRMQQMQAMQQRQFQQPSPFRGGSFMQNFAPYQSGLQSLMGQLRGRPASRPAGMQAAFPQSFGREQRYSVPAYSADYSGMSSATRAAMEAEVAKAAQEAAPAYEQYYGGGL